MKRFEVGARSLAIILCVYAAVSYAQNGSSNRFTPYQEVLNVSFNDNFYISGETIKLAFFCLSKVEKAPSSISKVAYVTLLDEEKNIVHQSKTKLSEGRGASEIFVKSSYPTGNYYLIAHTALMRNQKTSDLFVKEISIVNPFTPIKTLLILLSMRMCRLHHPPIRFKSHYQKRHLDYVTKYVLLHNLKTIVLYYQTW